MNGRWQVLTLGQLLLVCPAAAQTPILAITPTTLDFGCVDTGTFGERTLEIHSESFDPGAILRIVDIRVEGAGLSLRGAPELPLVLPGNGAPVTLQVRFAPSVGGAVEGAVVVAASGSSSTREVPILARTCDTSVEGCGLPRDITIHPGATLVHRDWNDRTTMWSGRTVTVDFVNGTLQIRANGRSYAHERRSAEQPWVNRLSPNQLAPLGDIPRVQELLAEHYSGSAAFLRDAAVLWNRERISLEKQALLLYSQQLEQGVEPAAAAHRVALFLRESRLVIESSDWPDQDPGSTHRLLSLTYRGWIKTNLQLTPHPRFLEEAPAPPPMTLADACALASEIAFFMENDGCWYELRRGSEWINPVTRQGN